MRTIQQNRNVQIFHSLARLFDGHYIFGTTQQALQYIHQHDTVMGKSRIKSHC